MRIPGLPDVTAAVRTLMPSARRRLPISDTRPDPGLFGPGSVTWRVMAEPVLMLGAGRALLLQAAHPLVAEGAIEHSTYRTDPYGRFERTVEWVTVVCFGTTAEARARLPPGQPPPRAPSRAACAGPTPPRRSRSGSAYSGRDAELLRWVLATFVDTMLVAHDAFVGTLTEADRDRFVVEWHAVAALMGVPTATLWETRAELSAYVASQLGQEGAAVPGAGSRLVAETVLNPPVSSAAMRPAWAVVTFTTVGLLPAPTRRAYGIRWTPAHAAAHRAISVWLRGSRVAAPRRLKVSPVYDLALARAEGRLPQPAAASSPPEDRRVSRTGECATVKADSRVVMHDLGGKGWPGVAARSRVGGVSDGPDRGSRGARRHEHGAAAVPVERGFPVHGASTGRARHGDRRSPSLAAAPVAANPVRRCAAAPVRRWRCRPRAPA